MCIIESFIAALVSSFLVSSQFPPFSDAKSMMIDTGYIDSTIALGINIGAGLPGINAVVITIFDLLI